MITKVRSGRRGKGREREREKGRISVRERCQEEGGFENRAERGWERWSGGQSEGERSR